MSKEEYEKMTYDQLCELASWLYEMDVAGEGDYYDELGEIAFELNWRENKKEVDKAK